MWSHDISQYKVHNALQWNSSMIGHQFAMYGGHWSGRSGDITFNLSHDITRSHD